MTTFLALSQQLRQEVGVSGTGPTAVTSQTGILKKLVDWIADATIDIETKYLDWDFLWSQHSDSTIADTKDMSAPSDLGIWDRNSFFLNYTASTYKKLVEMDYDVWRNTMGIGTQTSSKSDYFIIKPDQSIILHPRPDAIYTLTADYWKTPTRMTANDDTPDIPSKFDRAIISRAKIYYAEHENAPEVMEAAGAEYRDLIHRMESLYLPGQKSRTKGTDSEMVIRPE